MSESADRCGGTRRDFLQGAGLLAGGLVAVGAGTVDAAAGMGTGQPSTPAASDDVRARFRALLTGSQTAMVPVVYDAISARLCEVEGFPAVFAGGQPCSAATYAMGDYGMVTITELIEFASRIADAVNIPVMADADDAGGNPLNVYRAVQRYERAGIACMMMEDMYGAKHLRPLGEGRLTSTRGMVDKIHAALDARRDRRFAIMARCDALSADESIDQALERSVAYAEAGADTVLLIGVRQPDWKRATGLMKAPLSIIGNNQRLAEMNSAGVRVAIYAGQMLNAALGSAHRFLKDLKTGEVVKDFREYAIAPDVYSGLIRSEESIGRARKYRAIESQ